MNHLKIRRLKNSFLLVSTVVLCSQTVTSCFKDEPLNAECDILRAYVKMDAPLSLFYNASDTSIAVISSATSVNFGIRIDTIPKQMAVYFDVTPGATISPASGTMLDFSDMSHPQQYTVTSEDGNYSRTYNVSFKPVQTPTEFDFEQFRLDDKSKRFYVWSENNQDGIGMDVWASGNRGFAFARPSAKPDAYPTIPITDGSGYDGNAVKLTTLSTGPFGMMGAQKRPIAAGNLYLGTFDEDLALTNTLHATRFGIPFNKKPLRFEGYYKYAPGPKFTDQQNKEVKGEIDKAAIYAVLYRNHDDEGNSVVLYGDNVETSPQIVAMAELETIPPTDEWTPFVADFAYSSDIDPVLLANFGYNIAIVFSSSANGDRFRGAVGSCLQIDKVRLVCNND